MATSAAQLRVIIKRRLFDLISAATIPRLDGGGPVQVLYALDRDLENEVILIGAIEGERRDPPNLGGGARTRREDVFTVDVICSVRTNVLAAEDQWAADRQSGNMAELVEDLVANSPGLGSGGGLADVEGGMTWAFTWIDSGPGPADLTEAGFGGVWDSACVVKVEVHARLT